jgi:L-lactate utilization protein LutC
MTVSKTELDAMVEDAIVDANDQEEALMGFCSLIEENLAVPFTTTMLGVKVKVDAIRPRILAIDRATGADEIRRLVATPEFVVNSVAAVTETGSLVLASGSGSQLPANAGGAGHAVWVVGAQKVVPDLSTALRRIEEHALPLESARSQTVYGMPSAINRLLILNADPRPGRGTVLLLREAIGY